jgi:hypothetical protein
LICAGQHPSSEGKRRRNRSNVEAMAAKHMEQEQEHGEYQFLDTDRNRSNGEAMAAKHMEQEQEHEYQFFS